MKGRVSTQFVLPSILLWSRYAAFLVVAFAGCGPGRVREVVPSRSAQSAQRSRSMHESPYRFVLAGGGPWSQVLDADGHVAMVDERGRIVVNPDGSTQTARMTTPWGLTGGEAVPARLGGGFLFWSPNVLYRSPTFLGPLEPVAPLSTNVIAVAFGHDSVLVFEPWGHRKAYSLDPPKRAPLSPHGVVEIAGADDERVVAIDAPGRALTSIDGGKTWSDVTAQLGGYISKLHGEAAKVGFEVSDKDGLWLQTDGQLVRRPLDDPHAAPPGGNPLITAFRVPLAIEFGVRMPDGRALVGDGPAAVVVDVKSGAETPARRIGPNGWSCRSVSTDDEGLFACYSYSIARNSIAIVSGALGATPHIEKVFEGTPALTYGAGVLVVAASCEGPLRAAAACVRRSPGRWTPYDVAWALPPKAEVSAWVPKEDGGVLAIDNVGWPVRMIIDAAHATTAPLDARLDGVGAGYGRIGWLMSNWIVTRDGMLRGFTHASSVVVDPHGHVTVGPRLFKNVSLSNAGRALARDEARRLWQTIDYGGHWVEIAPPPLDPTPDDASAPGPSYIGSGIAEISCSSVGCVMAHPSRAGKWVRVGWPEDPPQTRPDANRDASAPARPGAAADGPTSPQMAPSAPPSPSRVAPAKMRCVERGESTPRRDDARAVTESHIPGGKREAAFGGRVLEQSSNHTYGLVSYEDHFSGAGASTGPQSIGFGLRAIAHYEMPAGDAQVPLSRLVEMKASLEALFVEPFDPTGYVLRAAGSFASWSPEASAAIPKREPRVSDYVTNQAGPAEARPVLSSEPGHADGVLLTGHALTFWAGRSGAIRPVVDGGGSCSIFGGYVDAKGELLVACEDSMGFAEIREAETGTSRLRLSRFLPVSIQSAASVYPKLPNHVFTNPDSIAVSQDGKLGILRLPSGYEPSTLDDPAWFLTEGAPPIELAPWSTLEVASSPACSHGLNGVRAVVQTAFPWAIVEGAGGFRRTPGMTALVRWSPDRVCLEAVEVGYREIDDPSSPTIKVMAVSRFVGAAPGSGFVGTSAVFAYRQAATCQLE